MNGILYYCDGGRPAIELLMSTYTLLQCNLNPSFKIHIVFGQSFDKELQKLIVECLGDKISYCNMSDWFTNTGSRKRTRHWVQKPYIIQLSPFDNTLYYDCDHIFFRPLPADTFDRIEHFGLCTGMSKKYKLHHLNFLQWTHHFNEYHKEIFYTRKDEPNYFRVNGGCIGYSHKTGGNYIKEWISLMEYFHKTGNYRVTQTGDESAMSLMINTYSRGWMGDNYSYSVHPYRETINEIPDDLISYHFSRQSYCAPDKRKEITVKTLKEIYNINYCGLRDHQAKFLEPNIVVNRIANECLP